MATVTPGKIFVANEIVTPANLNQLGMPTVTLADNEVTTAKIANGAVTLDKFAAGAIPTAIPAGAVLPFAMNSAPSGWLAANGAAVSRTTYSGLFSAIGTTYGTGDGSTTFSLPDLRGYFIRGVGTNADGAASGTFGAKQADAFKAHTHTTQSNNATGGSYDYYNPNQSSNLGPYYGTNTGSTGDPTETRPKNIAMLYCIKF